MCARSQCVMNLGSCEEKECMRSRSEDQKSAGMTLVGEVRLLGFRVSVFRVPDFKPV